MSNLSNFINQGGSALDSFRNKIINGGFDVWQRGTSFSSSTFTADRWQMINYGGSTTTVTKEEIPLGSFEGQSEYCIQIAKTDTGTDTPDLRTRIEGIKQFSNKTVTLSFWIRALVGAGVIEIDPDILPNYGSTGDGDGSTIGGTNEVMTSEWKKVVRVYQLPDMSANTISGGDDYLQLRLNMYNQTQIAQTYQIANVQLEEGSVATEFERRPLSVEEMLCYRYYWKPINLNQYFVPYRTTNMVTYYYFPVVMRDIPTLDMVEIGFTSAPTHTITTGRARLLTVDDFDTTIRYVNNFEADAEL